MQPKTIKSKNNNIFENGRRPNLKKKKEDYIKKHNATSHAYITSYQLKSAHDFSVQRIILFQRYQKNKNV